jgi:drug/metabolite transporter (DMT)-like permease
MREKIGSNAVFFAILAAILYGISAPFSKLLLNTLHPALLAGLLYLGAGIGMLIWNTMRVRGQSQGIEAKLSKKDSPFVAVMIVLDIAAPISLMTGLSMTTAENASLLNNFEIVVTGLLAVLFFHETIGKRMGFAILLISIASILLSVENAASFSFSLGSIFVLIACICWGLENNCTRMLSLKNPMQIVVIKGFGSGTGALLIFMIADGEVQFGVQIFYALLLGFVAYGLSIFFYIKAQRELGAARTSAYYAAAPFIGVVVSWIVLGETVNGMFAAALAIMILGTYLAVTEKHLHRHVHQTLTHEHLHNHQDSHHYHSDELIPHSHTHTHESLTHTHGHTPDLHHAHAHSHGEDQQKKDWNNKKI